MENEDQVLADNQQNQEDNDNTPREQVITNEMVQMFGVPHSLVGQPIDKLAESYKNASKKLTKLAQENSELKKQKSKVKAPDSLDFGDDTEAYDRAMREWVSEQFSEQLAPFQQQLIQQQTANVFQAIQKQLPDANAEEVAQQWMDDNGYTPEDSMRVFQGDVNRVIKSIVNYQKAKKLDEVQTTMSKESGNKAIEMIQKSLKIQPKDGDLNSITKKQSPVGETMASRIAAKLENEQQFLE